MKEDREPLTSLNELLGDQRLERIFSPENRDCAIQLWILRIRRGADIENRIVYGRLLPYNHSDNTWYATDDEHFESIEEYKAEVVRINLYLKSADTSALLRMLASGKDIAQISAELTLTLKPVLDERIGTTALRAPLVFRPVSYLLNRDARGQGPLSPHGSAGALSASVVQANKVALLSEDPGTDETLTKFALRHLNSDTGLKFDSCDSSRLGEIELLVFPTLDDSERELLNVDWKKDGKTLIVSLSTIQLAAYKKFRVRLGVYNSQQLVYGSLRTVACGGTNRFECSFELPERLRPIADEAEVEIYGVHDDIESDGLCCRWRIGYIRQISLNTHVAGTSQQSFCFDWLENVTKNPNTSQRLRAALTVNQSQPGSATQVGGRHADPWVDANCAVESFLNRVHPQPSEGHFFQRLSDSNGLSRLELVEWFKYLMLRYRNHQVIIFDPYFEDAGMGMVVPNASRQGDYIVFTSLPKPTPLIVRRWYARFWDWLRRRANKDVFPKSRINNLLAACERLTPLMKGVRLRIFGLKHGSLHDRYILIVGSHDIPVSGFHLSNSLQKANENFPLLITPIPPDVLLRVHDYSSQLLKEAFQPPTDPETSAPKISLLFDSTQSAKKPLKRVEPLRFLTSARAGDVLAGWTGHDSLRGLSGASLMKQMTAMKLLEEESLDLPSLPGLAGCLRRTAGDFSDFSDDWSVLGEILANISDGLVAIDTLPERQTFVDFLANFVQRSFSRTHSQEVDASISHVAVSYFQTPLADLLMSSVRLEGFLHPVKYAVLSWAEFYAIHLLWLHSPNALLSIVEPEVAALPTGENEGHAVKLSLLSQIASEVAISGETKSDALQRERLIKSTNGFLQWMGWNLVEEELGEPGGFQVLDAALIDFDLGQKVRVLGWLIQRHTRTKDAAIFQGLTAVLFQALPATLTSDQTNLVVDSLRGPLRHLSWAEPWLYRDVVEPLLTGDRVAADDLCRLWIAEITSYFDDAIQGRSHLFRRDAEGKVTETAAILFGRSSITQQREALKVLRVALRSAKRDIQKPLASTSNWANWNSALVVAMWIYALTKWVQSKVAGPSEIDQSLSQLSDASRSLALVRPESEWKSYLGAGSGELAAFVEEVATF